MKKILTAMMMVLVIGVFANAQYFDMQRSTNIDNQPNVIRPEVTDKFSYLGEAYTLGWYEPNLTGGYGDYCQISLYERTFAKGYPGDDIGLRITFFRADGTIWKDYDEGLGIDIRNTMGLNGNFGMIIDNGKLFFQFFNNNNFGIEKKVMLDIDVFGTLNSGIRCCSGFIDYFAISGSGAVALNEFSAGGGWIDGDDGYFMGMQTLRGYATGFTGNPFFSNGRINFGYGGMTKDTTWSSGSLIFNYSTGFAMKGEFSAGGYLGLLAWDNLTFTFGSFERIELPEPATLLMLGLAAVGLPVVRRLRKR